ncbi:alpha/beta fold hydrolase [Metabacillus herbersteinensis]|uniref:Alpha/beta fold hydrolase n=1 Tax=Metabacillus herbersteinensis TaxID=283816 RepID=A0ABV6GAR0_9BACI
MPLLMVENGLITFFEQEGTGQPIVFIHPPGMGSVTFRYQQTLKSDYQVITYDMRGNGRTPPQDEKITISLLAEDLKQLMDALSIEKAVICGYSNGGSIAQEFAICYPERVYGLILIGGFSEVCTPYLRYEYLTGIYVVGLGGLPLLAKVLGKAHGNTKEFQLEIQNYVNKSDPYSVFQMYKEGLAYRSSDRLSTISHLPLLLVYGKRDFFIHDYQNLFKDKIKQTNVMYIPKIGHRVPTKKAIQLNAAIDKFVKSLK